MFDPVSSPASKKTVVLGMLGSTLDQGTSPTRWDRWRPTVSLGQQPDLRIERFDLLFDSQFTHIARTVTDDLTMVSPETSVRHHKFNLSDPWDFEEVYTALYDFARAYPFDTEHEDYLVHITTGTHVIQICLFLLIESRHIPARLLQTLPKSRPVRDPAGSYGIIDLDLSRYDRLAARFQAQARDDISFLKSGIETRNAAFNSLMERIERVGAESTDPILLTGPTGAGKSRLARRIYELRKLRHLVQGDFVEVNCATLRGDAAMSTLFGHKRGSFTGALADRTGLLRAADKGVLFLDEVGELGTDEQAMLLRAIEEKRFFPLGADAETTSDFQLICGSNRPLEHMAGEGSFREDLLARINLWSFRLPGLADRKEDIEPNLRYELDRYAERNGKRVSFNREALREFLHLATGPEALWSGNFRDLSGALTRMATLADGGRITVPGVQDEWQRLHSGWLRIQEGRQSGPRRGNMGNAASPVYASVNAGSGTTRLPAEPAATAQEQDTAVIQQVMGKDTVLDLFDTAQLACVIRVCRKARNLSEAGRQLFEESRKHRASRNDADRLRKYLARFGLDWEAVTGPWAE